MNNFHKNHKLAIGFAMILILMTVLVTGCTMRQTISDVAMSTGVDNNNRPINPTSVFAADTQDLYLSFKVSGFPVGSKLEVQWIYVGGDPETEEVTGKNAVVETQKATITNSGSDYTSTVYSRLVLTGYEKWPIGDYKVVITVDDKEKASTTFKIQ